MAINPEISLGIRPQQMAPLQIQSPLDRYQKMLTLRHLMTQGQLGQQNLEQTRLENEALARTARDEQSLGSWMQQNQQRPDLTPQEIVATHPNPTGIKFATAWSAQQTAALTQRKAVLDAAHEEAATDDRIYNSVTDDVSKLAALTELVRLKRIDGTQASHLAGIPFDSPEFKGIQQRVAAQSMNRLQRITAAKDEIALRIAQTTEPAVTQGAIAEGAQKTLDAAQKQKAADAATLAAAFDQSPQAGAAVLATLSKDPKRVAPFLNVTTAAEARQAGLTAEQQAAGARAQKQLEQGEYGKTKVYPPPVQTQRIEEAAARASASQNVLLSPAKIAEITGIKQAVAEMEPATEAENRSLGFYDRSAEADKTLESVKDHIKNKSTAGLWLIQNAPNTALSKEDQAYFQGARQFINAYLRRDSGAAIQPSEWDEAYKTFLPYPGDKPETLALKARERKVIIEGLKTSAGRAHTRKYGAPDATPTKQGGDQKKGADPLGIR